MGILRPITRPFGAARSAERREEDPMNPPRSEGFVRMPDAAFEVILTRAAEEGAKRALADVGLDGDEAALDIREPRSMSDRHCGAAFDMDMDMANRDPPVFEAVVPWGPLRVIETRRNMPERRLGILGE